MNRSTEKGLVARLRTGDREAFKEVYERFKGDVLALAATMLGHRDGAWDVLQDVFVSLARNAPDLAPDSNLKAYLLTAAANRARDHWSKSKTGSVALDAATEVPSTRAQDPAQAALRGEEARRIWEGIASLPEEQRLVVALHIYGDQTFKEIAESQGVSENTIQSRYRYALRKIRRKWLGERP